MDKKDIKLQQATSDFIYFLKFYFIDMYDI